jgi:hypothetical protein
MFDCANVEMRELLPDLAAGTLDAAARARVEQHVATCAECASELETLRLVRSSFRDAPAVDVARIIAALPRPAAAGNAAPAQRTGSVKRWMDWRVAAALTTITIGALSLAVSQRISSRPDVGPSDSGVVARVAPRPVGIQSNPVAPSPETASARRPETPRSVRSAASPAAQLSFGGGVSDLDDASIRALLGALEEIDRAPVAPSAEPDRSPVLPVIKDSRP